MTSSKLDSLNSCTYKFDSKKLYLCEMTISVFKYAAINLLFVYICHNVCDRNTWFQILLFRWNNFSVKNYCAEEKLLHLYRGQSLAYYIPWLKFQLDLNRMNVDVMLRLILIKRKCCVNIQKLEFFTFEIFIGIIVLPMISINCFSDTMKSDTFFYSSIRKFFKYAHEFSHSNYVHRFKC